MNLFFFQEITGPEQACLYLIATDSILKGYNEIFWELN
jgi:hypothetical protein